MDKKTLEQFAQFPIPSYEDWRKVTEASLKGASFEKKLVTHTYEGIALWPMYQKQQLEGLSLVDTSPGETPYTRGTSVVNKGWEVSQEIQAAAPKRWNEQALHDLSKGQTTLNIVLDGPTKRGDYPEEHPEEVGKDGLSLSTLDDVRTALSQVNLASVPLHVNAGANALPILALLAAYTKEKSANLLQGCVGMDPIGELVSSGELFYGRDTCYDNMAEVTLWASKHAPSLKTVLINSAPYHNGGANAVQELAYTLATGVEYLQALTNRNIDIDTAAKHIRFSYSVGANFFMEVAKLRTARTLWATIVAAFGGSEAAQKMNIHARTSAYTKTVLDPYVNMLRGTTEAFSAAVGGADSIHVSPFDEAIQKSTSFSRRVARNASIILNEEAHLAKTTDQAGGSWYVEQLTDQLSDKAWALFQEVEQEGGILNVLERSDAQQHIAAIAKARQNDFAHRKAILVGTNMYPNVAEKPLDVLQDDETEEIRGIVEIAMKRNRRNWDQLTTMGEAIEAVEKGASVAEIAEALGKQSQAAISIQAIRATRGAAPFETLRKNAELYQKKKEGTALNVFLANLGPIPAHKARADFAAGFMEVGGFNVNKNNGFKTLEETVEQAIAAKASVVVICGKDEAYQEQAVPIATALKERNSDITILLAGQPSEEEAIRYQQAGVSAFIHLRANCYEILHQLQLEKGVIS